MEGVKNNGPNGNPRYSKRFQSLNPWRCFMSNMEPSVHIKIHKDLNLAIPTL